MFGGLELKGGSSGGGVGDNSSKKDGDAAAAAITSTTATASSAFSFLSSAVAAASPAGAAAAETPAAAAASSAFSFLNSMSARATTTAISTTSTDNPKEGIPTPTAATDAVVAADTPSTGSSAFRFLSSTMTTTAPNEEAAATAISSAHHQVLPVQPPSSSSSFNFMQAAVSLGGNNNVHDRSVPKPAMLLSSISGGGGGELQQEQPPQRSSSFGFMSNNSSGGGGDAKSVSSISRDSPPPSFTEPAADLMTSFQLPPPAPPVTGAGVVFGGAAAAMAAASKKQVKKRTRTAKIGAAAQQQQQQQATSMPPPVAATANAMAAAAQQQQGVTATTRDAAVEATRRAEAFLHEKQKETATTVTATTTTAAAAATIIQNNNYSSSSAGAAAHMAIRSVPSEEDDVICAAKAAAAEAHKLEAQKSAARSSSSHSVVGGVVGVGVVGGFGSLFRSRSSHKQSPPQAVSSSLSSHRPPPPRSGSSTSLGSETAPADHHAVNHTMMVGTSAAERFQREQEDVKRAMAERQLQMMKQQQQQHQSNHGSIPEESADVAAVPSSSFSPPVRSSMIQQQSKPAAAAAAVDVISAPRPKTASDKFHDMLDDFRRQVVRSMNEVTRLRQHRAGLLEERFVTNAKERLAVQQKKQALQHQAAAAENEDFELADQMSATIERHDREQAEYAAILENIGRAIQELDTQKKACVDAVTQCFQDIQSKLSAFQKEQESADTKNAAEALTKYSAVSKQLSAEHDRLQNDLKHIERDSELIAEERKELEKAISEQSCAFEKLRDQARGKLTAVEEEIEELRLQLQAKQAVAAELRTEAAGHDESVLKVRVKFARQLTRLQKKEMTIKDNTEEWELEKKSFETQKRQHEEQVKEHSEAMLARDTLLDALGKEVEMADTFASIVAKEIGFEVNAGKDEPECDDELAQMQANMVKCEASVTESKAALKAVAAVVHNLEEEVKTLEFQIPHLEEIKRAAAERRDFKAAGKASKEIKEATSRLAECKEELKSETAGRKEAAENELSRLELDLEEARKVANEMERESGVATMARLADNIKRLVATKESVCGAAAERSIPGVGAFVLDAQIKVLKMEGQTYGDKYGGWADVMAGIGVSNEAPAATEAEPVPVVEKQVLASVKVDEEKSAECENKVSVDDACMHLDEKMIKFRDVTKRLKDCEDNLEAAVAGDDFEKAAELDEVLQQLLAEVQALNMTDDEMELSLAGPGGAEAEVQAENAHSEEMPPEKAIDSAVDANDDSEELGHQATDGSTKDDDENGAAPTVDKEAKDVEEGTHPSPPNEDVKKSPEEPSRIEDTLEGSEERANGEEGSEERANGEEDSEERANGEEDSEERANGEEDGKIANGGMNGAVGDVSSETEGGAKSETEDE